MFIYHYTTYKYHHMINMGKISRILMSSISRTSYYSFKADKIGLTRWLKRKGHLPTSLTTQVHLHGERANFLNNVIIPFKNKKMHHKSYFSTYFMINLSRGKYFMTLFLVNELFWVKQSLVFVLFGPCCSC